MIAYVVVWVFAFTLPWQNLISIPGLGTLNRTVAQLAVAATVVQVLFRGRLRPLQGFHIVGLVFMGWIGLSTFWTIAPVDHAYIRYGTYLQLFATLWAMWEVLDSPRRLVGVMQAYVLGAYVAVGSTIVNYESGIAAAKTARYAATGFDANDLAGIVVLAMPIAWYLAMITPKTWVRWLNRAYIPLAIFAVLLTGSRGGLLAMIVALSVIPWTLTRMSWKVRVAALLVAIAGGLVAVQYVPETSWKRLSTTQHEIESGTMNDRLVIWKTALELFPQRPLQGFGPMGFQAVVKPRLGFGIPAHNTFLSVMMEEGLIGLAMFLMLFIIIFWRLFRLPVRERRFALVLMATLTTILLPLGWESTKPLWLTLAFLYAISDLLASTAAARAEASAGPVPWPVPAPAVPTRRHRPLLPSARRR